MKKIHQFGAMIWIALMSTPCMAETSAPANATVASTATPTTSQPEQPTLPKSNHLIDCSYQLPQAPISEQELSQWAQYAAVKSFDFNFNSIDEQLQKLKYCYTNQGWLGFFEAFEQSGNLASIKSRQLTVSSQISGDPVINKIKDNQWNIELPLSVVYQNTKEKYTQFLSVTLVVTKKTSTELGIVQLIATAKSKSEPQMGSVN